jgi:tetratricopeptide (TPR) repeat protein
MPGSLRTQLTSIAGETAELLAAAKASTGDQAGAGACLQLALRCAREAKDEALGSFALAHVTNAHPSGKVAPEVKLRRFSEGDLGFSAQNVSPPAKVWMAAKAADVHASLGQREECHRALDIAQKALAQAATSEEGSNRPRCALSSWDERWLAGEIGASLSRLGDTDQGRKALDLALSWMDADLLHDRHWLHLARARTFVHEREPVEACQIAAKVLNSAVQNGNAALISAVRGIRQGLERWRAEQAVQELDERLALTG